MKGWWFMLRIGGWMLRPDGLWRWVPIVGVSGKYRWHDWRRIW